MATDIQEIYQTTILPLPTQERLRLASLILDGLALPTVTPLDAPARKEALDKLLQHAGAVSSGNPRSADNEQIDADLGREYSKDI